MVENRLRRMRAHCAARASASGGSFITRPSLNGDSFRESRYHSRESPGGRKEEIISRWRKQILHMRMVGTFSCTTSTILRCDGQRTHAKQQRQRRRRAIRKEESDDEPWKRQWRRWRTENSILVRLSRSDFNTEAICICSICDL